MRAEVLLDARDIIRGSRIHTENFHVGNQGKATWEEEWLPPQRLLNDPSPEEAKASRMDRME
jgi:hypothetical protein